MTQNSNAKLYFAPPHQRGLTLVEVMVALVLSLVLLGSMIQIYLSSKQTYKVNDALSRLQEGGRIALDTLAYDIRLASFQGCADPIIPSTIMATPPAPKIPITNLFQNGIAGSEGDDNPGVAGTDSDSITLLHADPASATAVGVGSSSATLAIAANPAGFTANNYLVVSDCGTADVFQATAATATSISHSNASNTPATTTTPYNDGSAIVYRLSYNQYFVANTGRTTVTGAPIRALYRTDANNTTTEIVDGVEYLEVLYGERLNNGNVRYVPANDATLVMTQVVSVRLGLLMASDDVALDGNDTRNYQLANTTIQPGTTGAAKYNGTDRRMRRVFTTTVRLRNRR